MNKKKIALISVASLIALYFIYSYFSSATNDKVYLESKVSKGNFVSEVITSGEAQSTSSKKINESCGDFIPFPFLRFKNGI